MKNVILFDQDSQRYRQSIYKHFYYEFKKYGYCLKIVYDEKLNRINDDMFIGINYNFRNFTGLIKENKCELIILYVWLRYKFLLPFMLYCRIKGIKMITWSHGINLQKKKQFIKNQMYYLRQCLANALIIYSINEKEYIKAPHEKLFIANNTLNFHDFPKIKLTKKELKNKYGYSSKKIVLCIGRLNENNRKIDLLIDAFEKLKNRNFYSLLIVGSGITNSQKQRINSMEGTRYLGAIYDPIKVNEIYKMSDVFCMPGAIGLAINHSFYYGIPVIIENVEQGPEAIYLKNGENGFLFEKGSASDLATKIEKLLEDDKLYKNFSKNAHKTILEEASIEKMFNGFMEAVKYVAK